MSVLDGWRNILRTFTEPSDRVIDPAMGKRIAAWADQPTLSSNDVKQALDEIVYASLSNDFVVRVLDVLWRELRQEEGTAP